MARQLAKSAPSVSANYHSAGRARSRDEFIAFLSVSCDGMQKSSPQALDSYILRFLDS
jgi:hypothetical protein